MIDQLLALGATLAAIFGLVPILTPWFQGGVAVLRQGWHHLVHASRNRFVVWTRNTNLASGLYLLAILTYLISLFFTTGAKLPWWGWLTFLTIILAMAVQRAFDQFVNAAGTGLRGSVIRTLTIFFVGTLVAMWVLMLVGCELNEQLVAKHSYQGITPANLELVRDWALARAHRVGAIVLFTVSGQVELVYLSFDWTAAGLRVLSLIEVLLRRALNGVIAGLDTSRTLAQVIADNEAEYRNGNMATFKVFIVNTWNRIPAVFAFFLLERALVFVWMDYGIALQIAYAMLGGVVGHLVLYGLFGKDGLERITKPAWWTFLPFVPAGIYITYWLVRGPYRESIFDAPGIHEVYWAAHRLTHIPVLTGVAFLALFGTSAAVCIWAVKLLREKTPIKNVHVLTGFVVTAITPVVLVLGGWLVSLTSWDGATRVVGSSTFDGWRFWDHGGLLLIILAIVLAVARPFLKDIADATAKSVASWSYAIGVVSFVGVLVFCIVGGYTREASAVTTSASGDVLPLPPGTLSRNQSSACIPALGTCNGTSQCCYGHMCYNGACQAP